MFWVLCLAHRVQHICFEFTLMLVFHQYIFSIPVRTIFDPHPEGCVAICMTMDAKYLATLSNSAPQVASFAFALSSIHQSVAANGDNNQTLKIKRAFCLGDVSLGLDK